MNAAEPNLAPPLLIPPRRKRALWKWLLGAFAAVVVFLILVVVVVLLSFDSLARKFIVNRIESTTGMQTELAKLEIHLREPGLHIRGFKLNNTAEFGGGTFIDLPEFTISIDRDALSQRKLYVKFAKLDIAEINVAVSKDGRTNYVEIQKRTEKLRAEAEASKSKPDKKPDLDFAGLDRFEFSFGKLRYTDLRDPDQSRVANLNVKDLVVAKVKTKEEFGTQLLLAVLASGINVLDLLGSGINNLPQTEK